MTCTCLTTADAMRRAFAGEQIEPCDEHDTTPDAASAAIALNDDAALVAIIGAALGAPVNRTSTIEN